jgi:hypothetical protein
MYVHLGQPSSVRDFVGTSSGQMQFAIKYLPFSSHDVHLVVKLPQIPVDFKTDALRLLQENMPIMLRKFSLEDKDKCSLKLGYIFLL